MSNQKPFEKTEYKISVRDVKRRLEGPDFENPYLPGSGQNELAYWI